MKCARTMRGAFSASDCPSSSDGQGGGKRRAAIPRMVAAISPAEAPAKS